MAKKDKITLKDGVLLTGAAVFIGAMIMSIFTPDTPRSPEEIARARRQAEKENKKKIHQSQLRARVFKRARGRCEKCDEKRTLKIYYIVGPYQNGRCTYNNLQGLCSSCGAAQTLLP